MTWLITGGAGYIGAHVVRDMLASGREVVVLDDLSTGRAERLPPSVPLVRGEVGDRGAVRRALGEHDVTAVMHLAARKQVGESVQRPLFYWSQNVGGLQVLLEEMVTAGVAQMVQSSSAAVYGQPALGGGPAAGPTTTAGGHRAPLPRITEDTPCTPINPYGATKLAAEWMVEATAAAHDWRALSLRYFNVAGAGSPELGDPAALNLIPMVLEALEQGRRPLVFGDDYPTPDGSCIRDYIHVADLSAAHVAAARVVESAHAAKLGHPEQAGPVRAASGIVHQAAEAAEHAAAHIPGGSVAVGVAWHLPAAAEVAAEAASRALDLAAGKLRGTHPAGAQPESVREQAADIVAEVAGQMGSLVARVAGVVESRPKLATHMAVNIGTGRGYSVLEVIEALRTTLGRPFPVDVVDRRPGDPPALVAAPDLAASVLGWRARHTLSDMTDSAWSAWQVRRPD